ncbi:MAG: hypothetical protein ACHQFW_05430 [Chitinophagales bacterium]
MKKEQLRQLKNYSAFSASFLLLTNQLDGQLIYTDVDPDINVYLDNVNFDFDNDGDADFKFIFTVETSPSLIPSELKVRINPLGDNKVVYSIQTIPVTYSGTPWSTYTSGATQLLFTVSPVINSGETIDAALNFQTNLANLYELLYFNVYSSANYQPFKPGDWMAETNKFAGLQLSIDGELHYGWVRLSVDATTGITVHDFAYEQNPDTPVMTREVNFSPAWLFANDMGTTGTGADLQFGFTAPEDEPDILVYRIICVKQEGVEDFTLEMANVLAADQYTEIIPDGSIEYLSSFSSLSKDSDGDLITIAQPYQLFILNVMDPASGFLNMISKPGDTVELLDNVLPVVDVVADDFSDLGNGADLQINFNAPETEQGITEYRIIIVKKDDADAFTISDAEAVAAENYIVVLPGSTSYSINLTDATTDSDGDLVEPAKYKAFVLSVVDGTTASVNALSEPSAVITIETNTSVVNPVLLLDVGETGDGNDIKITFPFSALEQTVEEYRVYLVDFATAFDFDATAALVVPLPDYISILPTETDIVINGNSATTDSKGNLITWGVPYYAYVLSMASVYGITDSLSAPSNQLILNYPVNIDNNDLKGIELFSANNIIHINLNSIPAQTFFSLTDAEGREVFKAEITELKTTFDLDMPSGIYIGSIIAGENILNKKIKI